MNTPNPLVPQGSLHANKGRSNVRLAVISIVAIHVVFFGGLLLQGCKRDAKLGDAATNNTPVTDNLTTTSPTLPPLDTNSLYYQSPNTLPTDQGLAGSATTSTQGLASTPLTATETTYTTNTVLNDPGSYSSTPITPAAPAGETKNYTVKKNDNYTRIAKAHGVTVSALKTANPTVDPAKLKIGQKLTIPAPAPKTTVATAGSNGAAGDPNSYTVVSGDTLTKIARKHHTTVSALRAANGMKVSALKVGQKIKIPAANQPSTPAQPTSGVSPLDPSGTVSSSGFGAPIQQ